MIVALDGPAASGKGTLAKRIASHLAYPHLDTGALYRAVARDVLRGGGDLTDAEAGARAAIRIDPATLHDPGLRAARMGEAASLVARHAAVRDALLDFQRSFAAQEPGAVLDGRDIGTVVCPDAEAKFFVTASAEVRAHRRYLELAVSDPGIDEAAVLADIRVRDDRDSGRAAAPLRMAPDAYLLDTSNLDIEAAFKAAVDFVDAAMARARCVR